VFIQLLAASTTAISFSNTLIKYSLMSAASQGHASVVKLLLDATALNAAVRSSKDSKSVSSDSSSKEIAPVAVDAATYSGGTALMFAAEGTDLCFTNDALHARFVQMRQCVIFAMHSN
jgi:hypothetical protein